MSANIGGKGAAGFRCALVVSGLVAGMISPSLHAIEVPIGDVTTIRLENLFTAGAAWRTQSRDPSLVGKSNLNPGICLRRVQGEFDGDDRAFEGDTCNSSVDDPEFGDANQRFVQEPGSFGPNADDGNTNFDRGDVVNAAAKLTTDISFNVGFGGLDFDFFGRTLMLFDGRYINFEQTHPDTTHLPPRRRFSEAGKSRIGVSSQILDGFVKTNLPFVGDRRMTVTVGRQVINWGESAFLVSNSLNLINPPNQALLRVPGFDIAELFRPQGMVQLQTRLIGDLSLQAFYQYEFRPVVADPVGSFFSVSDIVGDGGEGAILAFGKAPEDPFQLYEPIRNPEDPTAVLGSTSSRFIVRDYDEEARRMPSDTGQYGFALRQFFPDFFGLGGTEIGLYFANYHHRFPTVSGLAADETCIPGDTGNPLTNVGALIAACQVPPGNFGPGAPTAAGQEALPLDTARLFIEYPEDIRMYGLSFNTNIGGTAFSGEYAYRPNLPTQIHATDLVFALLQPAFPEDDLDLGVATLPGKRSALPDFTSQFRGEEIEANQYVRGFEELKTGQLNLNFIRFLGGSGNPFGASQVIMLLEVGINHVIDMPGLDELQFNGGQADTHISHGADGTGGIQPPDQRDQDPGDADDQGDTQRRLRQNPTTLTDLRALGTDFSWGYRAVLLPRYDNLIFGANVSLVAALFHDVHGTTPGVGGNFVEGRRQIIAGVNFDYLNAFQGGVRYTWFTGGGQRDLQRDRDNVQFFLGYQF